MSLYQLHRCIFDNMRAGEVSSRGTPSFDVSRYDLTDPERRSFETADIAALYRLGLHPVLLNGFCRAQGYSRNDYRAILEGLGTTETRVGKWHTNKAEARQRFIVEHTGEGLAGLVRPLRRAGADDVAIERSASP